MNSDLFENLLNEDEGAALDFKRDQYVFESATDEQKSELLKDILAFANSWRRMDAYILIGVEEVRGGRSRPVGVLKHLDDASLQQFVNAKTQKPVQFSYQVHRVDDVEVGVLCIPVQERPRFLKREFGRLTRDTVYIRRGSSTDVANPDEIVRFAAPSAIVTPAQLSVTARVLPASGASFVVAISNSANAGDARAPYLELRTTPPFALSQWGLDGSSGQHGLPLLKQGQSSGVYQFAGTADMIIHPGTSRDIALIEWRGAYDKLPAHAAVPYVVAAEGIPRSTGALPIVFRAG